MIKTKLKRYNVLFAIIAFVAVIIGAILGIFVAFGVSQILDRYVTSESGTRQLVLCLIYVWLFSMWFIALGLTRLIEAILKPLLLCNIKECNGRDYAEGFYILKRSDQPRELALNNLKTGGYIECIRDTYAVCVGFSYEDVEMAIYRMDNKLHSVYWEIPRSYIMPDGVTCLQGPKISLAAALKARKMLREDETVFFIYHVNYPDHKGQLAHADRNGEIVIIDTENSANYNAPA